MSTDFAFSPQEVQNAGNGKAELPAVQTLNDLANLASETLYELYRHAKVPQIEELDGPLTGRMLAVPSLQSSFIGQWLRHFSGSHYFPWQGKTFRSHGDCKGEGINRVLGNRRNWFRFETFIGPSKAGQFQSY